MQNYQHNVNNTILIILCATARLCQCSVFFSLSFSFLFSFLSLFSPFPSLFQKMKITSRCNASNIILIIRLSDSNTCQCSVFFSLFSLPFFFFPFFSFLFLFYFSSPLPLSPFKHENYQHTQRQQYNFDY